MDHNAGRNIFIGMSGDCPRRDSGIRAHARALFLCRQPDSIHQMVSNQGERCACELRSADCRILI